MGCGASAAAAVTVTEPTSNEYAIQTKSEKATEGIAELKRRDPKKNLTAEDVVAFQKAVILQTERMAQCG